MTESAESAETIIDMTISMHPQLKVITSLHPLSDFARTALARMLDARVFRDANPDPNNPRHATPREMELCMSMIECFITAYSIGVAGK